MKKILIVDDDKDILELLDIRLSSAGYTVFKTENASGAIQIAKKELPNLIILDVVMPGMDGGEIAETFKNMPETKNIPVIFLTGLLKKQEEKSGRVKGGKFFIAKPYDADDLVRIVRKVAGE